MTLPTHLFASDTDGSLYDTRVDQWMYQNPLRKVFKSHHRDIVDLHTLKATLRAGPGMYPLYFITSDSEALSFDAVRKNLPLVMESVWKQIDDGWRVVAIDTNYEDNELYCAHTNEKIDPAYGD